MEEEEQSAGGPCLDKRKGRGRLPWETKRQGAGVALLGPKKGRAEVFAWKGGGPCLEKRKGGGVALLGHKE